MNSSRVLRTLAATGVVAAVAFAGSPTAEAASLKVLRHSGSVATWGNRNHWSPLGVPTSADLVAIDSASPQYLTVQQQEAAAGKLLVTRADAEISGATGSRLRVSGDVVTQGSASAHILLPTTVGGDIVTSSWSNLRVAGGLSAANGEIDKRGEGTLRLEGQLGLGTTLRVRTGNVDLVSNSIATVRVDGGAVWGTGGATTFTVDGGWVGPVTNYFGSPSTLTSAELRIGDNAQVHLRLGDTSASKFLVARVARLNSSGRRSCRIDATGSTCPGPLLVLSGSGGAVGTTRVVVDNLGNQPVAGGFRNLREGGIVANGNQRFRISYVGGDGNDVTLTRVS